MSAESAATLRLAESLDAFAKDAHDAEIEIVDFEGLANGCIRRAVESLGGGGGQQADLGAGKQVAGIQEAPGKHLEIAHDAVFGARPQYADLPRPAVDGDPVPSAHDARGGFDEAAQPVAHGVDIGEVDVVGFRGRDISAGFVVGVDQIRADALDPRDHEIAAGQRRP